MDDEKENFICDYCGKDLDKNNEYHTRYGTCDKWCFADNVGVTLYEH